MISYDIVVVLIIGIKFQYVLSEACHFQTPCILNDSYGNILSPGYPNNSYPRNVKLAWIIKASHGQSIRLLFEDFALEQSKDCSFDNIAVYDGNTTGSPLIGEYCGNNKPPAQFSSNNQLLVVFISDRTHEFSGFNISYESFKKDLSKCSLVNNANENENIKLNGYHGNFTVYNTWKDMKCRWRIDAPSNYQIELKFVAFTLENDCRKASLQIFDGVGINRGKFCGPEIPWEIYSTTGFLMVHLFVSESSKKLNVCGTYEAVTTATGRCSTMNSKGMNTNIQLNSGSGLIMTPNYPSAYPSNFQCVWVINVPAQYRIKLHFKTFQLEAHKCRYDYVEVRDGGRNSTASKTGRICGESQLPDDVYSSSNKLTIWFFTDDNEERNGFLAYFQAVHPDPSKCAMVNTANENNNIQVRRSAGFLTSPNYPQPSPAVECTWYIVVSRNSRIILHIHDHIVAPVCSTVHFAVHDGNCTCNKFLWSFCDNDTISTTVSSGNALTVVFSNPLGVRFTGFNLTYHVPQLGPGLCSAANSKKTNNNLCLDKLSGQVTSPDYPYWSFPSIECTWYAEAPRGHRVLISMTSMNMSCANHYVEVRDGGSTNSPLKGRFCSLKVPKQIFSSGRKLVLRYKSPNSNKDDFKHAGKFVANYLMIKEDTCSGDFDESWNTNLHVITDYRVLTSPDYPRPYPPNIKCTWKITVSYNSRVQLQFGLYSFGGSCSTDFVEVKDGFSSSGKLLGKFCKNSPSKKLQSSGRYMHVHFESGKNSSVFNQGFQLIVSSINADSPSRSSFETVLIMGLMSFAGFVALSVCFLCIYWLYKKRRTGQTLRRPHDPPEPHDLTVLSVPQPGLDDIPDCLIAEDRPPPYDDAVQTNERDETEPPEEQEQLPDNTGTVSMVEQVERGLDNPAFTGEPPTYESLYGRDGS